MSEQKKKLRKGEVLNTLNCLLFLFIESMNPLKLQRQKYIKKTDFVILKDKQ